VEKRSDREAVMHERKLKFHAEVSADIRPVCASQPRGEEKTKKQGKVQINSNEAKERQLEISERTIRAAEGIGHEPIRGGETS